MGKVSEILNRWAEYSKYDAEKTRFNMVSSEFYFNRVGRRIQTLLDGYDPDGVISVLYAKSAFLKSLKDEKASAYDLIAHPEQFDEEREMFQLFSSGAVAEMEDSFLESIGRLVSSASGEKYLPGFAAEDIANGRDQLLDNLLQAVDSIADELPGCNFDLFERDRAFAPVSHISRKICVFERLSDCLLAASGVDDAAYLCYIGANGSIEGYFGILIKSNGNLLFVNDRVDEAFPGQHAGSRNARWTEEKKIHLFPYEEIVRFGDSDYKGFPTSQSIDDSELNLFRLPERAFLPIVLAVSIMSTYYTRKGVEGMPLRFVSSLFPANIQTMSRIASTDIALLSGNALVLRRLYSLAAFNLDYRLHQSDLVRPLVVEMVVGTPVDHDDEIYRIKAARDHEKEDMYDEPGMSYRRFHLGDVHPLLVHHVSEFLDEPHL